MKKHGMGRRAAIKALGTTAGAAALAPWLSDSGFEAFAAIQRTGRAPAPKLLSAAQYAAMEALAEAIIPTDERSPGAKAARVADYIDLLLSEAEDEPKAAFLSGLAAVDREASTRFGAPVARLSPARLEALLTGISRNEANPQTELERFFTLAKQATIRGYYTSEIGIHKDLRYKGNQFVPEFVGCVADEGKDCPHCGQKAAAPASA
jgi:hypothetical protein